MLDTFKVKVIVDECAQENTYIPTVDTVFMDNGCGSISLSI